ncbi:MAG TPA: hypothetical protein VGE76_12090 [Opitutaceae bacterium]
MSQLKERGMPVNSVEAARAWRAQHDRRGTTQRGPGNAPLTAAAAHLEEHKPLAPGARPPEEDPAAAIWRAREAERIAYDHYAAAVTTARASDAHAHSPEATAADRARADADLAPLQSLLRAHGMALTNRLAAERAHEKHLRATGQVAPVEHLVNVLRARLDPLAARLRDFPAQVAPKVNPAEPTLAQAAIAAELEPLLNQITAAANSKIPPEPQ